MKDQTVGRFAPSPSGRMHLGNVLCALLAWLSARSKKGAFLLRIEDLDVPRCPRENAAQLIDDLCWLGLDWDDIPSEPLENSGYASALHHIPPQILSSTYQSERTPIYESFADLLNTQGLLYPCFCTRAELHAASAPHLSDGSVIYSGACRHLSAQAVALHTQTRAAATRIRVPNDTISFCDGCMGAYCESLPTQCGDFIIRRSDGVFAYQLAVTVDDGLMGVNEVVRGNDLIGSTARQIWLHTLFGFSVPAFYHIPLLLSPDGRRLSKRDRDLDLAQIRTHMKPEKLIGILAHAAGILEVCEPISAKDLVSMFSWDQVKRQNLYLSADIFC